MIVDEHGDRETRSTTSGRRRNLVRYARRSRSGTARPLARARGGDGVQESQGPRGPGTGPAPEVATRRSWLS